jgi:hypothetical protein
VSTLLARLLRFDCSVPLYFPPTPPPEQKSERLTDSTEPPPLAERKFFCFCSVVPVRLCPVVTILIHGMRGTLFWWCLRSARPRCYWNCWSFTWKSGIKFPNGSVHDRLSEKRIQCETVVINLIWDL